MARRRRQEPLSKTVSPQHTYTDHLLSTVVTRAEVMIMWKKAAGSVDLALARGQLDGRKSLSGGAVLITLKSVTALWGPPRDNTLFECYNGKSITDEFETVSETVAGESI
jgi:hypothetical protein